MDEQEVDDDDGGLTNVAVQVMIGVVAPLRGVARRLEIYEPHSLHKARILRFFD